MRISDRRVPDRTGRTLGFFLLFVFSCVRVVAQDTQFIRDHFAKCEVQIPMRDGARLFTSIYTPNDTTRSYPFMLQRTPYGVGPYGPDTMKNSLGPSTASLHEGFIFVYQDVRGRMMSEGEYVNMTPHRTVRKSAADIDESTDTYDTIEWLLKNVPHNNGRAGMWGISYPGFYAAAGMIDAHPALKAVSPQAPIADWFVGDDFHHNGAFFLMDAFGFFSGFGQPRPFLTTAEGIGFDFTIHDAYRFYLDLGPLRNVNRKYLKGAIPFWNDLMTHGRYDDFWKARNILPHLHDIVPAVLVVGGWFDAEDLYGPLAIFRRLGKEGDHLVMGPWPHGGWGGTHGGMLGDISFGSNTSPWFQMNVELPFFVSLLKRENDSGLPKAIVFETGSNRWRSYNEWPPARSQEMTLYFSGNHELSFVPPAGNSGYDDYVSDPDRPVPYTAQVRTLRGTDYMIEDQRFAFSRPDVLAYETPPLADSMSVVGPIIADLYVSTTGTDADFVVKLIDEFPDPGIDPGYPQTNRDMGGFQMLVRAEVMRGKFRNSLERPEPFVPGKVTSVKFDLPDVNHTFLPGHRIMVQVQSSWFPLVDRNPQTFVDIYGATEVDFRKATHRVYRRKGAASRLVAKVMKSEWKWNSHRTDSVRVYSTWEKGYVMLERVVKTDDEWRKQLTAEQYKVTRMKATELACSGAFWNHHEKGIYSCVCCGLDLFSSDTKFESGTGWPSFWQPVARENLREEADSSLGLERTEVLCARCDAHLGHVFEDGPGPTGLRYCINSVAFTFRKTK